MIHTFSLPTTARGCFLAFACCILVAVLTGTLSVSAQERRERILWPIDAPPRVSSSFGEPRPGRFHYGVDFKSAGVTGREVYSIGDGYIRRVTTSPYGYGKALYIRLDSGHTAVYGHLSRFLPGMERRLFSLRIRQQSYDVDLWLQPGEVRVSQGELVAYSGDTGTGAPHLHFELRDSGNVPLNPLEYGLEIRDEVPPTLDDIVLIPLDVYSTVDGLPVPKLIPAGETPAHPILLTGRIGVAAAVWDRVSLSNNHVAPYRLSLAADSTVVFSKVYDRLPYDFPRDGALDYLGGYRNDGNGLVSALFRREGNHLGIYEGDGELTRETAGSGQPLTLTVRGADFSGNTTERTVPVMFAGQPYATVCGIDTGGVLTLEGVHPDGIIREAVIERAVGDGWEPLRAVAVGGSTCSLRERLEDTGRYRVFLVSGKGVSSHPVVLAHTTETGGTPESNAPDSLEVTYELYHDRAVVTVRAPGVLRSLPKAVIRRNSTLGEASLVLQPVTATSWCTVVSFPRSGTVRYPLEVTATGASGENIAGGAVLSFTAVDEGVQREVLSPDSYLTLSVPSGALFRPAPVTIRSANVRPGNGLHSASDGYAIVWGDEPMNIPCRLQLTPEQDVHDKAALYGSVSGRNWQFISMEREDGRFVGDFIGSGYCALMVDSTAPWVAGRTPRAGSTVSSRQPLLSAALEDRGSGIGGSDSIRMWIDDIRIFAEYDPERNMVRYTPFNPLSPGRHTVTVEVSDRTGNVTTREWRFTIAP